MKKGNLRKNYLFLFALVMAFLFALCLNKNISFADETEKNLLTATTGGSFSGTLMINDVPLSEVTNAKYGDTIMAQFNWSFADGEPISSSDLLVYNLPAEIRFTDSTGDIKNEADDTVGSYTIANNQIAIRYSDETFLGNNNRKGKLSFSGTIDGTGVSNDAPTNLTVVFDGIGSFPFTVQPPELDADVSVDKKYIEVNPSDHIYDCVIVVTSTKDNSNVLVKDEMYPGMEIKAGSIPKFYTDEACTQEYSGAYSPFVIDDDKRHVQSTIDNMTDGQKLYVKFQVQVFPEMFTSFSDANSKIGNIVNNIGAFYAYGYEGRVPGVARVSSTEHPAQKEAWADIYTLRYSFIKWGTNSKRLEEGMLGWAFVVNSFEDTVTSGWIIDTPPANSIFVKDFDTIVIEKQNGDVLTPVSDYISIEDVSGNTVKIVFEQALLDALKESQVTINYYTKVTKQTSETENYSNSAEIFLNGNTRGSSGNSTNYTKPKELNKSYRYDAATAPYAYYTVKVNPAALEINPNGDDIIFKDTMGSALDLDTKSVKVNNVAVNSDAFSFDKENRTFTINLSDNTAYTITYRAKINLMVGASLNVTNAANSCELVGIIVSGNETPTVINATVYTSAASSSSDDIPDDDPENDDPDDDDPGIDNPGNDDPGNDDPDDDDPGIDNPGNDVPTDDNPGIETPSLDKPNEETGAQDAEITKNDSNKTTVVSKDVEKTNTQSVQTGDVTPVILLVVMLACSMIGLVYLLNKKRS